MNRGIQMNSLIEKIYSVINDVEQYVELILLAQNAMADRYVSILLEDFSDVLPKIIKAYDEISALPKEDQEYWIAQMSRIIDTLEGKDAFAKIDVLYSETCENMLYFANQIGE